MTSLSAHLHSPRAPLFVVLAVVVTFILGWFAARVAVPGPYTAVPITMAGGHTKSILLISANGKVRLLDAVNLRFLDLE